jgi:hypothetical protein
LFAGFRAIKYNHLNVPKSREWSSIPFYTRVQDQALKIASHITHPVTIAAFALVFAATALALALRAKKPRIAWVLATGIIILGLAPLAASTFLQSRGIYRVRVGCRHGLDAKKNKTSLRWVVF